MGKKIYLLETDGNGGGYDTFDSCVVVANSEEEARLIHPEQIYATKEEEYEPWGNSYTWVATPEDVTVTLVGEANDNQEVGTIVCTSFNAG